MDDYSTNILSQSKDEWAIILLNLITHHIIDGFRSIFNSGVELCKENDELDKYLMTFQNLLARIPKWNQTMIDSEKDRIVKLCNCSYLEDVLTCIHIIQLKVLSCVRVGAESKKINIDIPDLGTFIHQVYINVARKLYSNIYLFEIEVENLQIQKYNREFELLVQTCIMNTIRDKMPIETLLRQYIDSTQEVEVTKVERVIDTKPMDNVRNNNVINNNESNNNESNIFVEEKLNLPINFTNNNVDLKPFQLNENLFESSTSQPSTSQPSTSPKVGFSDKNSVLTFETPNEDIISLGDEISGGLDFEDLDLSKSTEVVELKFEEL